MRRRLFEARFAIKHVQRACIVIAQVLYSQHPARYALYAHNMRVAHTICAGDAGAPKGEEREVQMAKLKRELTMEKLKREITAQGKDGEAGER